MVNEVDNGQRGGINEVDSRNGGEGGVLILGRGLLQSQGGRDFQAWEDGQGGVMRWSKSWVAVKGRG